MTGDRAADRRALPAAGLLSLVFGAAFWEAAGRAFDFRFLPPFSSVAAAAAELIRTGQLLDPLTLSIASLALGYCSAVAAGVTVGVAMGLSRLLESALSPFFNAMVAAPKIALVPILYAVFGLSRTMQVAIVFLSAFFLIAMSTARGIQRVDPALVEMAAAFGADRRQLISRVLLPGSLPLTMAGLRLGMGHAVRAMVTAEMLIAVFGIGALLRLYGGRFDTERLLAVLLAVVALALLCSLLIRTLERRLTAWAGAGQ
jgi:NitT/TauT family transport system permease protein